MMLIEELPENIEAVVLSSKFPGYKCLQKREQSIVLPEKFNDSFEFKMNENVYRFVKGKDCYFNLYRLKPEMSRLPRNHHFKHCNGDHCFWIKIEDYFLHIEKSFVGLFCRRFTEQHEHDVETDSFYKINNNEIIKVLFNGHQNNEIILKDLSPYIDILVIYGNIIAIITYNKTCFVYKKNNKTFKIEMKFDEYLRDVLIHPDCLTITCVGFTKIFTFDVDQ